MNKIWLFMMLISIGAVYAVWLGLLEIVDVSGLGQKLARLLRPLIKKLFRVDNEEIQKMIALNMSANMLGLGNAATPMGIKAMQALDDGSGKANFSMIMLIVVNATSIQLLPSTVISLRSNAGSADAADIILPTLLSTIVTTGLGIVFVLICYMIHKKLKARRRRP